MMLSRARIIQRNTARHSLLRCFISSRTRNNNSNNDSKNKTGNRQQQTPESLFLKKGFQPTGFSPDGVYMGSTFLTLSPHTLPELDVSPLLDSKHYGRIAGHSINGNDAAIRLTQAKRKLREIMEQELLLLAHSNNSNSELRTNHNRERKMYILRNHGVPHQLLQHIISAADQWLTTRAALELCVESSDANTISVVTNEGAASWETLWPTSSEWKYDMDLYLAVMRRMITSLGTMAPRYSTVLGLPDDWTWKVSISRQNKLPLTLFPRGLEVMPVIEWGMPKEEYSTQRTVSIRLQGAADPEAEYHLRHLKKSHDVSLTFEANFEIIEEMLNE